MTSEYVRMPISLPMPTQLESLLLITEVGGIFSGNFFPASTDQFWILLLLKRNE